MAAFKKILCPVDLDSSARNALELAGDLARQSDAEVHVLHVVPVVLRGEDLPALGNLAKRQQEEVKADLAELASHYLGNVHWIAETALGDPAVIIVASAKRLPADLIVMSTHGRRGFSRFFLGSVAEAVMSEVSCPVLTVKIYPADRFLVRHWMTPHPITITPAERLPKAVVLMQEGKFRSLPVVADGRLVGILTDRDIRTHLSSLDSLTADQVMTTKLITVTPRTSVWDAARLLS